MRPEILNTRAEHVDAKLSNRRYLASKPLWVRQIIRVLPSYEGSTSALDPDI
jgi:hypothetical protein